MTEDLKQYGRDIAKILPRYVKIGSVPAVTSQDLETQALEHAKDFLSNKYRYAS